MANTSAPLVPGEVQFFNGAGVPLANGLLYTYVFNSTTPKTTWQTPTQTQPNDNPVQLDGNGRAVVFGTGLYRLQLFDAQGNQQWDAPGEATDPNFIASVLPVFTGDTGTGGAQGLVPAPIAGSSAAGYYLSADGNFQPLLVVVPGTPSPNQAGFLFVPQRIMISPDQLRLTDAGGNITNKFASPVALTIPSDTTVPWVAGVVTQVMVNSVAAASTVSIRPASGVTLVWPGSSATSANRTLSANAQAVLSRIDVNTWTIAGAGIS